MKEPVRIANCSGFFGDRLSAAREMVEGGPIDVLTGDWLAELTMLILARQRMKHGPGSGYARTFLAQLEEVLGTCLDRGIRIVSNAGGLDPAGLGDQVQTLVEKLGLQATIGVVTGDDLMPTMDSLSGERFENLDTGEVLAEAGIHPITANAYLGAEPITRALEQGADIVVTGRVTDASLVVGPAAWWHGWSYDPTVQANLDRLAGAVAAGHIIECGPQATGGNYAFFREVPGLEHPGFPIAEVAEDGSAVITKHSGSGGMVTVGTVTAQVLYEIGSPAYANPDVTAHFDTMKLSQQAPDRVLVSGVVGSAPPERLKVAMNYLGGFRNSMTLVLTGAEIEAKAELAVRTVCGVTLKQARELDGAALAAASTLDADWLEVALVDRVPGDPEDVADAQAHLRVTVKAADPARIGKPFTSAVIEPTLGSFPGYFPTTPPSDPAPFGVYWPTTVPRSAVRAEVAVRKAP
jgi:hypothetical protein